MTEAKQGYVRTWLSDAALIVFVTTITAYSITYFYEFGFCHALAVPSGFISLQTGEIVADLALLLRVEMTHLLSLSGLVTLLLVVGGHLKRPRPTPTGQWLDRIWQWTGRYFLQLRSAAIFFVLVVLFWPYFHFPAAVREGVMCYEALVFPFSILLTGCVVVFLLQKARLLQGDQLRVYAFEVVAYLIFFVLISICIGWDSALRPTGYPFLDRSPNTIVLRMYGDKFVTAQYDSKTGTLTSFEEINSLGEKVHWKQVTLKLQKYESE
jgi:hypothetical protein